MVEVSRVMGNRYQPRRLVHDSGLAALSESIRRTGLMQPIVVRPAPGEAGAKGFEWELVAGERRLRAAEMAGVARLPALARELTDEESAEWALVENVQREDLNPMDRAAAFARLGKEFGLTHNQIAERVGLDRSTVTNLMRLNELEEPIQDLVASGKLTMGHARALLAMGRGKERVAMAEQVVRESWSVRRLEHTLVSDAIRVLEGKPPRPTGAVEVKSGPVREVEKRIADQLGTKVVVKTDRTGKKGKVIIDFYSVDHFEGLLGKMGLK